MRQERLTGSLDSRVFRSVGQCYTGAGFDRRRQAPTLQGINSGGSRVDMSTLDPIVKMEQVLDQLDRTIMSITPAQADQPTPCEGWDVRQLLGHILGGLERFTAIVSGDQQQPATGSHLGDDWHASYRSAKDRFLAAWSRPGALEKTYPTPLGEVPAETFINLLVVEGVAHAWDLAKATGQTQKLDDGLAAVALPLAEQIVPAGRRGGPSPFAPVVAVPANAPMYDRLIAYLGRQP